MTEHVRSSIAGEQSQQKQWYIIQVYSSLEDRVVKLLQEHIRTANLEDKFGEIIVPKEKVVEKYGSQERRSEQKFYPGYVLIQMEMNDETWYLVRRVPNVLGFVGGTSHKPTPISDKKAKSILRQVEESKNEPKPNTSYRPGEEVQVIEGPFKDYRGTVEEVNYGKGRLKVAVIIFGRSTPLELEFRQVKKN